jgi:hypothetical protein
MFGLFCETNSKFIDATINSIPIPLGNEYSDYKELLNSFVIAINTNNIDQGMKCFPIKEIYFNYHFENLVDRLGTFSISSNFQSPLDEFPMNNYFYAMGIFVKIWNEFTLGNTIKSNLNYWIDEKTSKPKWKMLGDNQEERSKKINELKDKLKFISPNIEIIGYKQIIDLLPTTFNQIDKAIGISEKKLLEVELKINNEKTLYDVFIGKHLGNWQIISMQSSTS